MTDQKPKGSFAKLMSTTPPPSLPTEDVHKLEEIKAKTEEAVEKKQLPSQLSSREEKPRHINNDTMIPRHHDTTTSQTENFILEVVRKAVKLIGREAATHRFTLEEKNF